MLSVFYQGSIFFCIALLVFNIVFGIFGFCITGAETECWNRGVGYDIGGLYSGPLPHFLQALRIALTVGVIGPNGDEDSVEKSLRVLIGFLVLYPIATGLSFVACLTALAAHYNYIGGGWSVVFASIACVAVLLALIMTFVVFTVSNTG